MMQPPLYQHHNAPKKRPSTAHLGLWFDRFYRGFDADWQVGETEKANWIKTAAGLCGNRDALAQAAQRKLMLTQDLDGRAMIFKTDWHFVTGMGLPHPVENGFAWHPTLGVPYLSGAAVKGLVRAFVECWDETLTANQRNQRLKDWFGTETHSDIPEKTGDLIFFDAIPIDQPTLATDVMTPHLGKWYAQGAENPLASDVIPGDWHDPVPIPFLVVKQARFLFCIAPRVPAAKSALDQAFNTLQDALQWLGAGAKAAVGYGLMEEDQPALDRLQKEVEQQRKALERAKEESEIRNISDPVERAIREAKMANEKSYLALLNRLKTGKFTQSDEQRRVAEKIKEWMQADGIWKETSEARKPERDKIYQRTQEVLKYLGNSRQI